MFFFVAATLSRSLRFRTKTLNERVNDIFASPFKDARREKREEKRSFEEFRATTTAARDFNSLLLLPPNNNNKSRRNAINS